jgi:hypothetical protein
MSLFLLIIIYKLLIDVREVKTRFKLIKHIDTEKLALSPPSRACDRGVAWTVPSSNLFFYAKGFVG